MKEVFQEGQGEWVDKKSRFIGRLIYVKSEDEVNQILDGIRKEHYSARHHCYSYILGDHGQIKRFSDDREPSGTAGKPILEVLERAQLSNALLVVIRYFGGVLLGTGGLVHAYQNSARIAVENSILVERFQGFLCKIEMEYGLLGKIQHLLKEEEIEILSSMYQEKVILEIALLPEQEVQLSTKLKSIFAGDDCMERIKPISFAIMDGSVIIL